MTRTVDMATIVETETRRDEMSTYTYTTKTTDRWGNTAESSERDWNWVLRGMLWSMANEYTAEVVMKVGTETMLRYMRDADGNWHSNL